MRHATDLLVVGGGMAGLTAAGRGARGGLRVALVERAPELGGSAVLSGAKLWTVSALSVLVDEAPVADTNLVAVVVDEYPRLLEWLDELGVDTGPETTVLNYGRGRSFDVLGYVARTRAMIESAGGSVVTGARTTHLRRDGVGRVVGARVEDRDGATEIEAGGVILATGGFQASDELRSRYLGPNGAEAILRSNPYSGGDGLRLGLSVGAVLAGEMSSFYGHLMCWPVAAYTPDVFGLYAQGQSEHGILLTEDGARFCDESLGDHANANAVLGAPGGRALLIADEGVRKRGGTLPVGKAAELTDKISAASEAGANVAFAETPEELAEAVVAWGFPGQAVSASINAFNELVTRKPPSAGDPPRRRNRNPLDTTPLHAMEVRVGVTATHGGLAVDSDARVLRPDGRPIPGLFAAGADAGGVYGTGYAGGLAMAGAFGSRAARAVLASKVN